MRVPIMYSEKRKSRQAPICDNRRYGRIILVSQLFFKIYNWMFCSRATLTSKAKCTSPPDRAVLVGWLFSAKKPGTYRCRYA